MQWSNEFGYNYPGLYLAAIELEVFRAIGEGNSAVPEIAKRCQTSERGMRILCDYLCIMGFLAKDGGRYGLNSRLRRVS